MIRETKTGLFAIVIAGSVGFQVGAQTPAPTAPDLAAAPAPQVYKKRSATTRVQPVIVQDENVAPQIVTILHRLSGLKVIRQLLRYNEELEAIANIDEAFRFSTDAHTNVIAGLALEDGETIAAWLPEASAEIPPPGFNYTPKPLPPPPPHPNSGNAAPVQPQIPQMPEMPSMHIPGVPAIAFRDMLDTADLKVVTRDGKRLAGRYIGIDGLTGLSVIALANSGLPRITDPKDGRVTMGQHLRVLGPEPAPRPEAGAHKAMYFRVGQADATVVGLNLSPSGALARIKVKANKLSAASIGSIAINDAGETIGIIDSVRGSDASIVPLSLVRSAAKRVLARQASVPRPWLGVRGEPIEAITVETIQGNGWNSVRAKELADKRCGILLTSVIPGSPAARYKLKAGDVILSVNDEDIKNAEEFTWLLQEAGPGSSLKFTVARPGQAAAEAFAIELSESPDPLFGRRVALGQTFKPMQPGSLISQGIETIAIKPKVAMRFGATGGLLVVYVQPATEAFKAGIRPGDVIQAIDGRQFTSGTLLKNLGASSTFDIVRNKQKLTVTVSTSKPAAE